jgi:hypothetical protein
MGHKESNPKRKKISLSDSKKKQDRTYTRILKAHLNSLEPKEANSPKRSRQQEIIKLRAEINQVATKRIIQRINQTRSWFFEKINNIDKPLASRTTGISVDRRRQKQVHRVTAGQCVAPEIVPLQAQEGFPRKPSVL